MDYINGYALALFALAKDENKIAQYKDQAQVAIAVLSENENYLLLLNCKNIPSSERKRLVGNAFGDFNSNLVNFMCILIDKTKVNLAVAILQKLIKLANEYLKINEGVVYTPEKLTAHEVDLIAKKVARRLKLEQLSLVNKIDREIVSGFKVVISDQIVEDTISSRLYQIRQNLIGNNGKGK